LKKSKKKLSQPLRGYGRFVAHRILKLQRGTILSAFTQGVVAFFMSAIIHTAGDFAIGNSYGPTTRFFLLQPVAMAFEGAAMRAFASFGFTRSRTWTPVGWVWVYIWFCWCAPPWFDSISARGGHMRTKVIMFKMFEFFNIL
jgi:Membrane bound O-acyl transferase family